VAGDTLKLLSRNGRDRTALFREPFRPLAGADLPPMVLDGEITVPDERGVTHIDALSEAISAGRSERLAYFAFDLLHLDGHDLRRCAIEDRKALLRDVIGAARCPRIVHVDYVVGIGRELFQAVRQIGAEGIVSKRAGSAYRGGESRDWLKAKCHEVRTFVITGFSELGPGRLEAVHVAEMRGGELMAAGQVRPRPHAALGRSRLASGRTVNPKGLRPGAARACCRGQILRWLPRGLDTRRRAAERRISHPLARPRLATADMFCSLAQRRGTTCALRSFAVMMIVEDFADISRRRRGTMTDLEREADCSLSSERNSEYRDCRRYCGHVVHGVTRTCDGSCHIAS
jgi:ATP dependent DNA ligase-like protein